MRGQGRRGRQGGGAMTSAQIKVAVESAYHRRQLRMAHPQGHFDKARRFLPSDDEDAGDIVGRVRAPSRAWPFSYMTACRARRHVAILVQRCVDGLPAPHDIRMAVDRVAAITELPIAMEVAQAQG